jgi:hypothetical protein
MQVLNNFEVSSNFWDTNPQLVIPFKDYRKKDKTKSHHESSKIMWAIALVYHPESKFKNLSLSERKTLVEEDYLNRKVKLDWDALEPQIKMFQDLCLTKTQRLLISWEKKLDERQALIDSLTYTLENYDDVDKLVTNTEKVWKVYRTVEAEVQKEQEQSANVEGGAMLSLADQGDLFNS